MADPQNGPGSQPTPPGAPAAAPVGQPAVGQPGYPQGWIPPQGTAVPPGWGPPPGYGYPQQGYPQQYFPPQPGQQQPAPGVPGQAPVAAAVPAYPQPGQGYPMPGQPYPQAPQAYGQPGQPGYGYPYNYPPGSMPPGYGYPQPGQLPPGQVMPNQVMPGQAAPGQPVYAQPMGYPQPVQAQPVQPTPAAQPTAAIPAQPPQPPSQPAPIQSAPKQSAPVQTQVVQTQAVPPAAPQAAQPAQAAAPATPAKPAPAPASAAAPPVQKESTAQPAATPVASQPAKTAAAAVQSATPPTPAPAPVATVPVSNQSPAAVQAAVQTPSQSPAQTKAVASPATPAAPTPAVAPQPGSTITAAPASTVTVNPLSSAGTANPAAQKKGAPAPAKGGKAIPSSKAGALVAIPGIDAPTFHDRLQTMTFGEWLRKRIREAPGYIVSVSLHLIVLFLLSLAVLPEKDRQDLFNTIVAKTEAPEEINDKLDDTEIIPEKLENIQANAASADINTQVVVDKPSPVELDVSDAAPAIEAPEAAEGAGPKMPQGDLAGRTKKGRAALAAASGGTAASELAVESGLKWLSKHQRPDGSWSFKHGPDEPGTLDNPTGATGMALLAYLGAGHTHKQGDYKREVGGGLKYLLSQLQVTGAGGDMRGPGGSMYVQGICAIALCEAYALSKDKDLKQPTQLAINFIINAQDPKGGGWRYTPGQAGDTSAVGWQIMALKSAKIAKLTVPPKTIGKATAFLNFVQTNGGANYGYDGLGAGPATSAVGLLCRMYLGWTPKQQGLVKGVEYIGKLGPQPGNMYFNYYGTQVMHHWGGEPWTKWNNVMRDYLVKSQEKAGAAAGSWKPMGGGDHGDAVGGRHYRTCMSIMTLEVYYRHLPLYQRETIKVDF